MARVHLLLLKAQKSAVLRCTAREIWTIQSWCIVHRQRAMHALPCGNASNGSVLQACSLPRLLGHPPRLADDVTW